MMLRKLKWLLPIRGRSSVRASLVWQRSPQRRTPTGLLPPLLHRRAHMAELGKKHEVVSDLQQSGEQKRPTKVVLASIQPARLGLSAAAKLRGTAVKLAAAWRSAGVTTAMT